jgi:hypothetical protein
VIPAGAAHSALCNSPDGTQIHEAFREIVQSSPDANTVRALSQYLFATLLGEDAWTRILACADGKGASEPIELVCRLPDLALARLPWEMMREVYERRAIPAAWPRPSGLSALDIDKTTGYKATPFCPKDVHYIESFIPGTEPTAFCPIHSPFGNVGGVMGGTGPAPGVLDQPSPAPAIGVPQADTVGAPLAPARSRPGSGPGVMGGSGPAASPHR